jgi:putative ABC transport system ATP-binding protein
MVAREGEGWRVVCGVWRVQRRRRTSPVTLHPPRTTRHPRPPSNLMVMLETRKLSKYYRRGSKAEVRALHEVSLAISKGSLALLTGRSGSGKTTLLALLGSLERPTTGQVIFGGKDLSRLSDAELTRVRRRVGFVFQDFSLLPRLPVWENITYPLVPRGLPRRARFSLARALLVKVGLEAKLESRVEELSGGEQQRVAIARALAGEPEVLLADEPTSNVDQAASLSLMDLFREFRMTGGTVVVATHDSQWISCATDVYHLEAGRLQPGL